MTDDKKFDDIELGLEDSVPTEDKEKEKRVAKKFDKEKIIDALGTAAEDSKDPFYNKMEEIIKKYNISLNQLKEIRPIFNDTSYLCVAEYMIEEFFDRS